MNNLCDCFHPLVGVSPDDDSGSKCSRCESEVMDRRCDVCKTDFDPLETEERSDGKWVCRKCYFDSLEFV